MAEYHVHTDVYNGPMDLLLFLIKRDEIDICDIPISHVTQQYYQYIDLLKVIDPNVAGEFLILAAQLMEIKSRMLLPRTAVGQGEDDDLGDPRMELVQQLLEYKRYKDASFALSAAAEKQAARWPRRPTRIQPAGPEEVDIEDVQIWDLVAAFNKLMVSVGAGLATHDVVFDDTPIALHAVDIVDRLQAEGGELLFEAVFRGRTKSEMIGLFLALLELMRQQRIRIAQARLFGEIRIQLVSAEPIEIGDTWDSSLRTAVLGSEHGAASGDDAAAQTDDAGGPSDEVDSESGDGPDDNDAEPFDELDQIKTEIDFTGIEPDGSTPHDTSDRTGDNT
ncbi:MAG: segregation and condensation protein A [Phycisphaerae bacterium]